MYFCINMLSWPLPVSGRSETEAVGGILSQELKSFESDMESKGVMRVKLDQLEYGMKRVKYSASSKQGVCTINRGRFSDSYIRKVIEIV